MTPCPPGFSLFSLAATSLPSRLRFPLSLGFDDPQWFVLSPLNLLLFLFVLPGQPHLLTGFQSIFISRVQKSHPHPPPAPKCPTSNSNSTLPNVKSFPYHFPPLSTSAAWPIYPGSEWYHHVSRVSSQEVRCPWFNATHHLLPTQTVASHLPLFKPQQTQ